MSATPPTPPDRIARPEETVAQLPVRNVDSPSRRVVALGIVLFVSFGHFIASSAYYSMGGIGPTDSRQYQVRLLGALIAEAGSLAVLWYVLSAQGRSWKSIGWNNLRWTDIPRALGLAVGSTFAGYMILVAFQISFHASSGHYLATKSMHGMLGNVSVLSFAFVCVNPFFEELIVRGYLMTEIVELGGKGALAIVLSVAVQMSYHLYQGLSNCIVLTTIFVVSSIYFLRSRRIAPVVLAHLCIDAYALFRGSA
jgi:membrane protease YdiL (CAAX protease family)